MLGLDLSVLGREPVAHADKEGKGRAKGPPGPPGASLEPVHKVRRRLVEERVRLVKRRRGTDRKVTKVRKLATTHNGN